MRFLVKVSVVRASSTRRPLIRSSTSRAFCGDTRVNRAFAVNSMSLPVLPNLFHDSRREILRLAALAQDDRSGLPLRSRPLNAVISKEALTVQPALSRPDHPECPRAWRKLPPPPSSSDL